jgi:hypothetical protein
LFLFENLQKCSIGFKCVLLNKCVGIIEVNKNCGTPWIVCCKDAIPVIPECGNRYQDGVGFNNSANLPFKAEEAKFGKCHSTFAIESNNNPFAM